jgi:hypothetical protein
LAKIAIDDEIVTDANTMYLKQLQQIFRNRHLLSDLFNFVAASNLNPLLA